MSSLARHVHTSTAYHLQLSHKTNTLVISYRTAADCFPFGPGPDAQPHCTTCPGDCNHRGCNSCPAHPSSSPRWRCCSIRPSRRIVGCPGRSLRCHSCAGVAVTTIAVAGAVRVITIIVSLRQCALFVISLIRATTLCRWSVPCCGDVATPQQTNLIKCTDRQHCLALVWDSI